MNIACYNFWTYEQLLDARRAPLVCRKPFSATECAKEIAIIQIKIAGQCSVNSQYEANFSHE